MIRGLKFTKFKDRGPGRGWWGPPKGDHVPRGEVGRGEGIAGYSPLTDSDSEVSDVFNQLTPADRLKANLFHGVVTDTISNNASKLIKDMGKDEATRERALVIVQNSQTGKIYKQSVIGQFGRTELPAMPEGHRRIGLFHTHPPGHSLTMSEADTWKFNPMLRSGGIFAIGGFEKGAKPIMNVWTVWPGDRWPRQPRTVKL